MSLNLTKYWPSYDAMTHYITWGGAWNKAPSDFRWIAKFFFQFSSCMFVNQRENLTLDQGSLRTLFHAPLHLISLSWCSRSFLWMEEGAAFYHSLSTIWQINIANRESLFKMWDGIYYIQEYTRFIYFLLESVHFILSCKATKFEHKN